jgi:8-oxo-dGTP diphosphatase
MMRVVVAAAIHRDGRLLVARRAGPPELAGRWELPGGKVEADELDTEALVRECREELDVDVTVGRRVGVDLAIRDGWTLRAYAARLRGGVPRALEHLEVRWVTPAELEGLDWLPGNALLIPSLHDLLRERD